MDEQDWMNREPGQPYTVIPEDAPQPEPVKERKKKSNKGRLILLFTLILAVGATITCCMVFGLTIRFSRFEGGFSLRLDDRQSGSSTAESASSTPNTQAAQNTKSSLAASQQPEKNAAQAEQSGSEETEYPEKVTVNPAEDAAADFSSSQKAENSSGMEEVQIQSSGEEQELTYQQIYKKLSPSVCSITASASQTTSSGSGIVISEDGYIATNAHVVSGAQSISVMLSDEQTYDAQLIGTDTVSDLAVLKIDATGLTAAEFGNSDELEVGDSVVAIGDPLGSELRGTMTDGIISAINRDLQVDGRTMTLLQTNAALNEGNSGGPLINMKGQVIGINTMKMSSYSVSIEGLGFAIPSTTAVPILDELMTKGYVSGRPDIGFEGITVPVYAQFYYRLPSGVYIQDVQTDSDAAAQGISTGDVLTQFDGKDITSLEELQEALNAHAAGDTVTVTIYSRGYYYSLDLTLSEATN